MVGIFELIVGLGDFLDVAAVTIVGEFKPMNRFVVVLLEIGNGVIEILKVGFGEESGDIFFALGVELLGIFTIMHKIHQIASQFLLYYTANSPHIINHPLIHHTPLDLFTTHPTDHGLTTKQIGSRRIGRQR